VSDLVSLSDFKVHLGETSAANDALLTSTLEDVEALFEAETGRKSIPFATGASRTEVRDGSGLRDLFLDYPISTVSTIKLGYDPSAPVETLNPADLTVVTFAVGSRKITRTDGSVFGWAGQPRFVQVAYTHQTELPRDAQIAIKSVGALVFRRRGAEEATQESTGGYSRQLIQDLAESDPFWQRAVSANRRMVLA
jgi:hypothetical protein